MKRTLPLAKHLLLGLSFAQGTQAFCDEVKIMTQDATRIEIKVTGLKFRNQAVGVLRVALYRSADGFPDDPSKAFATQTVDLKELSSEKKAGALRVVFDNLQGAGTLAASLLHDENGTGVLETGLFGIPKEGVGFSQNPSIWRGKPDFKECAFAINPGTTETMVEMVYF